MDDLRRRALDGIEALYREYAKDDECDYKRIGRLIEDYANSTGVTSLVETGATPPQPAPTVQEAVEVKRLLLAYMDHVISCEGTDFLNTDPIPGTDLTDNDREALRSLSQQEGGVK